MAVSPDRSLVKTEDFLKLILFHGIIVGTLRSEKAFDWFVAVHMLGATWWGWEAYRDPVRQAGRLMNIGSGDSLGDNAAALHLLTVIPFALFYLLIHKDKWMRGLALLTLPFVANAIILCNSRGAMIGLLFAGAVTIMISRLGHRLRGVGAALALALTFYVLADPEFIERQQTTARYEQDGSAIGRIESWAGGLRLILDHPFGAGGAGYVLLSPIYIPAIVDEAGDLRAPHNTIILVASEWGLPGLLLFISYYLVCASLLRKVRTSSEDSNLWYYRSVAIQMSMAGLFIGGLFTDRLYAEAPYWMGGLAVALHRLNRERLLKVSVTEAVPQRASSPGAQLQPAVARSAGANA
jgi:O-antigen ligase